MVLISSLSIGRLLLSSITITSQRPRLAFQLQSPYIAQVPVMHSLFPKSLYPAQRTQNLLHLDHPPMRHKCIEKIIHWIHLSSPRYALSTPVIFHYSWLQFHQEKSYELPVLSLMCHSDHRPNE